MRPLAFVLVLLLSPAAVRAQYAAVGGAAALADPPTPSVRPVALVPAPSPEADLPVYYVVHRRPERFAGPGTGPSLGTLEFRRGVRVLAAYGPWRQVQDVETGEALGWVRADHLSNVWIQVDKASRTLFVYRGSELLRALPADVSQNPYDDKVRRSRLGESEHYRIPEGVYFVTAKNPNSQYYRSFLLSYPNAEDAARGLRDGLITPRQYEAIVRANERFETPPQGTLLGGAIAIHGQGSGRRRAWTRGCVALRDIHMDELWEIVHVGTPVFIR